MLAEQHLQSQPWIVLWSKINREISYDSAKNSVSLKFDIIEYHWAESNL